jgi:L-cysteine desulfidase
MQPNVLTVSCNQLIYNYHQCHIFKFNDITHVHQLAKLEYQAWRTQLRESSVNHELVTPLRQVIKLSGEMLKVASGEARRLASIVYKHAKIINARIGDILFNQNNRDGNQESLPNLTVCSLVKVVQETIFLLQEESLAQQIELIYSGPLSTKAAIVKTDPQKI